MSITFLRVAIACGGSRSKAIDRSGSGNCSAVLWTMSAHDQQLALPDGDAHHGVADRVTGRDDRSDAGRKLGAVLERLHPLARRHKA